MKKSLLILFVTSILLNSQAFSQSAYQQKAENLEKCQNFFKLSKSDCLEYFKYNWQYRLVQKDCVSFDVNSDPIETSGSAAVSVARKGTKITEKTKTKLIVETSDSIGPKHFYYYTTKQECQSDKKRKGG
jgi:hypothetical protein